MRFTSSPWQLKSLAPLLLAAAFCAMKSGSEQWQCVHARRNRDSASKNVSNFSLPLRFSRFSFSPLLRLTDSRKRRIKTKKFNCFKKTTREREFNCASPSIVQLMRPSQFLLVSAVFLVIPEECEVFEARGMPNG